MADRSSKARIVTLSCHRGALISAINTLVTDAEGRVFFAPVAGETGAPYTSFSLSVDDSLFAPATAQVTVNVALPELPQFTNLYWDINGPAFNMNFSGSLNATYSVWASTNLSDWERLGTAQQLFPAQYQFMDSAATNWPQRFYRISAGQ